MTANVAGTDGLIALVFVLVMLGLFAAWLWGLIDAIARPGWAFDAAGSNKGLWLVLIILLGGIPGLIYLISIRPRVRSAAAAGMAGWNPLGQSATAGPGWHPDPYLRHQYRYWDGMRWTDSVSDAGVTSSDPTGIGA